MFFSLILHLKNELKMKLVFLIIATFHITIGVTAQSQSSRLIDSISLFFRYNDYLVIDSEALSEKLQSYQEEKGIKFKINGYSDTLGPTMYNQYLSEKRNEKTRNYIGEFIPNANVQDVAFGENHKYNTSKASTSRRVDIFVYKEDKPIEDESILSYVKTTSTVLPDSVLRKKPTRIKPLKKQTLSIMFVPDEAIILAESFPEVESLYQTILLHDDYNVELHGHVCCYNQKKLSKQRAKAIKRILIAKGISKNRIKIYGHGNSQPITEEKSESEKAENRRVEVIFLPINVRK
jgi:outer membrane protein OmpA-like peptidoglycan-associated protein